MKRISEHVVYSLLVLWLILVLSGLTGCGAGRSRERTQVLAINNRNVVALNPDDIVRLMLRAGFSDRQIIATGKDLRNTLALAGAAQLEIDGKVHAIFAVDTDYVYVTSRTAGSFIYSLENDPER